MQPFILIELINFKCWTNKTFRLELGVNLISGDSGTGKSTLCKAIHFVIFGGRKFTDLQNWNYTTQPTKVTFQFNSEHLKYTIVRTRPTESLTVYILEGDRSYELKSQTAQDWICNQFGAEDKWIASSMISMKKPHFLLNSSNADKMSLLQHISFGDVSARNQPETYLNFIKIKINEFSAFVSKIDDEIRIQQGIRNNIIQKNHQMMSYGNITREDLVTLIKSNNEEILKLEKLRRDYNSISSRRFIEKKIKEVKIFDITIDEVDIKLDLLTKIKRISELKEILKSFDKDVLVIEKKILDNNTYLYSKYLQTGWIKSTPLKFFLDNMREIYNEYKDQLDMFDKNRRIENENNKKTELNNSVRLNYEKDLQNYNLMLKIFNEYNVKKDSLENEFNIYNSKTYNKINEEDDMTLEFLINLSLNLQLSINELICPNCNHGLKFQNEKLCLGILNDGEESRIKNKQLLESYEEEILNRKKREKAIKNLQNFMLEPPPSKPEIPIEPNYSKLETPISIKEIKQPILNIFEEPSIEYDKLLRLNDSFTNISLYKEYEYLNELLSESEKNFIFNESEIANLLNIKKDIIESNSNIKCLKESLIGIIDDDPEIENKILSSTNLISYNNEKIEAGKAILEIYNINSVIESYDKKRTEIVVYISTITELYNYIQELGTNSLQDKIDEVNGYIGIILDDLFKDQIDVKLSSHKDLKNGDRKLQINFDVDYKGHKLKGTDGFSEGEEERLSISLLTAFSRMNSTPIIIIDEVLAGMNEELRMKCIGVIERWSTDKFVIHVCHSIVTGMHSNVIMI
uniref:RecF/RecN/SMC N-terminal domain-containing protein n=1 Tax=viral metagenome TaxID=1070528 RepID=A0A6C0BDP4_9ZZZZ